VKELRVTFDVDMNTDGYSWCGGGESFPEINGTPQWIDKRTCVLPVKLMPGKSYRLGINAPSFQNFKNADGVPVVPVGYSFETKGEATQNPGTVRSTAPSPALLDSPMKDF